MPQTSMSCVSRSPLSLSNRSTFFHPSFIACVLGEASLAVFDIHGQMQFNLGISFPNFMSGCFKNVPVFLLGHPTLLLSLVFFLFQLNLLRKSLFIHTILPAFLPNFLFIGMEVS